VAGGVAVEDRHRLRKALTQIILFARLRSEARDLSYHV
jgi:hypothetical protein